jgi:peptide/nickel transport system permease protein
MACAVLKKTLKLLLILFAMSILAFFCIHVMPGDPIAMMYGDRHVSAQVMNSTRHLYHLDLPVWKQYLLYLRGLLHGSFGYSYFYIGKSVNKMIAARFSNTLKLAAAAFPVSAFSGLGLGILSARYRGRMFDRVMNLIISFFTALPDIPLALFLVLVFAVKLQWFPIAGWNGPRYMVLPVCFVALWPALNLSKFVRSLLCDEIEKPYVFMCRTRGMGENRILFAECLPNLLVPVSTKLSMMFAHMLNGALIAEIVFNIPGLGRIAVDAITRRDYPVIMAVVLLSTLIYTAVNYAIELVQIYADPRRKEGSAVA